MHPSLSFRSVGFRVKAKGSRDPFGALTRLSCLIVTARCWKPRRTCLCLLTAADAVICQRTRANESVPRYRRERASGGVSLKLCPHLERPGAAGRRDCYLCTFTLGMSYSRRQTPRPASSRVYLWKGSDSAEHTSSL